MEQGRQDVQKEPSTEHGSEKDNEQRRLESALREMVDRGIAVIEHFPARSKSLKSDIYLVAQSHLDALDMLPDDGFLQAFYQTCQIAHVFVKQGVQSPFLIEGLEKGQHWPQAFEKLNKVRMTSTQEVLLFSDEMQTRLYEHSEGFPLFKKLIREWMQQVQKPIPLSNIVACKDPQGIEGKGMHAKMLQFIQTDLRAHQERLRAWGVLPKTGDRITWKIYGKYMEVFLEETGTGIRIPLEEAYTGLELEKEFLEKSRDLNIERESHVIDEMNVMPQEKTPILFYGSAHAHRLRNALQNSRAIHLVTPVALVSDRTADDKIEFTNRIRTKIEEVLESQ